MTFRLLRPEGCAALDGRVVLRGHMIYILVGPNRADQFPSNI